MKKDEHVLGSFVRIFTECKLLSRDALEILSALWTLGTGKKGTIPTLKDLLSFVVKSILIQMKQPLR